MKCPECGKHNDSNFKFCQFCGHSLSGSLDSDPFELPSSTLSSIPDDFDDWFVDGDNPNPSIFANMLDEDEKAPAVYTTAGKALKPNAKAIDSKIKPFDSKAKSADSKAKPSNAKAKPGDTKSKSADSKAKPFDLNFKPFDLKVEPFDLTPKSTDSKKQEPPQEPSNQVRLSPKLAAAQANQKSAPAPEKKPEPTQNKPVAKTTTKKKVVSKPKIVDRVRPTNDSNEPPENRQLNLKVSSDAKQVLSLNERVLPEPEKRNCAKCGSPIIEGHRFCGNCGTPIDTVQENVHEYDPVCDDGISPNVTDRVLMSSMHIPNTARDSMTFGQIHAAKTQEYSPFTFCHINNDGSEGERFQLFMGENIIGRGSSEALRNDQFVSPKHARILCSPNKVVIEDFNSLNGVFFRISNESIILYSGDIFRIGEELLLYAHGNSDQPILANPRGEETTLIGGEESQGWGYLRSILGPFSEGNVYRLWQPTVTLGRTRANIIFPLDGFVSGTHASLKVQKDYAILTDLNSSNGTFVRLKEPMEVMDTAHILIGNQLIRISHH